MELWDAYDIQRHKTGQTLARGEAVPAGAYHLAVHVCLFSAENKMLIQRRQPFKKEWPGLWDLTAGGSALLGETSQAAAQREVEEELGIRLDLEGVRPQLTVTFEEGFDDLYLLEREADLAALRLQPEEVADARWATQEEILLLLEKGEFVPYYPSLIRLLFAMRGQYGGYRRP